MKTVLAIDIGHSFITIYKKNCGIVLKEPNLIAVSGKDSNYKIIAMGLDAKKMQGKTAENTVIFSPIAEGEVKSTEYLSTLLRYFLDKLDISKFSKIKAYITVPCGTTEKMQSMYKKSCYMAGIDEVYTLPAIVCAAYGSGKTINNENATFIASFGGGVTEAAIINLNSIIKGGTLAVGGRALDVSIASIVASSSQVLIGVSTAERVKEEIASLYENDTLNIEVSGVNTETKTPQNIVIFSKDIKPKISSYIDDSLKLIETTLNLCPPEISADISQNGLLLVGGGSKILGLDSYISKEIKMPVEVSNCPDNATILGLGKLLSDEIGLKNILNSFGG